MLNDYGYKARPVSSGAAAIRAAQSAPPDLILLDINMPQMDGYEVCRRLKADERLKPVPVIFISGLNEPLDKVRAFQLGGVDYITKPFEVEEVAARVETHLNLCRQQQALAQSLYRLRELERLRDALTQMIVHDMRSPLLALQLSLNVAAEAARASGDQLNEVLRTAQQSTAFLVEMVAEILEVSQLEAGALQIKKAPEDW
jgi:two-component system sensor histidine kinase/response regulator